MTDANLIWLNVASSHYFLSGFVNIDNDVTFRLSALPRIVTDRLPARYQDRIQAYREGRKTHRLLRHDCRARLPFADGSADHVLCSHFLEHLYPTEADAVLRDFHRVLKPGGTIDIIVPSIEKQAVEYLEAAKRGEAEAADRFVALSMLSRPARGSLAYRILEMIGGFGLQHRWMYDHASMTRRVEAAGFSILAENNTPSRTFREGDDDNARVVARKT